MKHWLEMSLCYMVLYIAVFQGKFTLSVVPVVKIETRLTNRSQTNCSNSKVSDGLLK